MAIIPVTIHNGNGIQLRDQPDMEQKTFKEMELKEEDIEEFIKENPDVLLGEEESLLIVGQQVHNQQRGISDLVAIDDNGSLVLIEIKRDEEDMKVRKEAFEFQAIRYAANLKMIKTPQELVDKVYADYIERHRKNELVELTSMEKAKRDLDDFLAQNNAKKTFNQYQRIILIASEYDEQTASAVAWLNENGVDISCFTLTPISYGDEHFLQLEKLLPPPQLDDFYVEVKEKDVKEGSGSSGKKVNTNRRKLPRMDQLLKWGIIEKGQKLKIKNYSESEAEVIDEKYVHFNGEQLSYNQWGKKATGWSSLSIYAWAIPVDGQETLDEQRKKKMQELEEEQEQDNENFN